MNRIVMVAVIVAWYLTPVGSRAQAQISYVDQTRTIQTSHGGTQSCLQSDAAPDFGPWNDSVSCGGFATTATQNSSMGGTLITCTAQTSTSAQPNTFANATSVLTSHFTLRGEMHYTLTGQVSSPGTQAEVKLTGPSGVLHHPAGAMSFSHCGTLAAGSYEIHARTFGAVGSFGSLNFALSITKTGDINGDQSVNVEDLLAVIGVWGACTGQPCPADLNCDTTVNVSDLLAVIGNWG